MSYLIVGKAFMALTSRPVERAVLMALCSRLTNANLKKPVNPSVAVVAKLAGIGESRTVVALRWLVTEKYIVAVGSNRGGRNRSTAYKVNTDRIVDDAAQMSRQPSLKIALGLETVHDVDGIDAQKGPRTSAKGSTGESKRVHHVDTNLGLEPRYRTTHRDRHLDHGPTETGETKSGVFRKRNLPRIPDVTDHLGLDRLADEWGVNRLSAASYDELRSRLFAHRQHLLGEAQPRTETSTTTLQ